MKRLISFLLCTVLLLSFCIVIPAMASQPTPTVALSSSQGSAGEEVSVTATIANNSGIVSMYLQLDYDRTRLQLVSVTDHGLLSGKMFSQTIDNYPYMMSWDDSAATEANTANGALVTLTFKILDDAPLGDAEVRLSNSGGILDFDLNPVAFDFVAGKISVVEDSANSEIVSADVVLGQDITVNYYARLDPAHIGAEMRFTMNGNVTVVSGEETEEDGVYVYAFQEVAPQCMGDNIKAELVLNGAVLAVKAEYSVRTYCLNMLAKSASELGLSAQKYAALKTLIADMLEYGAQAQMYKNYKTNNLVNQGITGQSEFVELDPDECDEIMEQVGTVDSGVYFVAAGMYFDYYNALYIKFNAPGKSDSNFRIRFKDIDGNLLGEYKLSDCELISEEDGTYVLTLPALYATGFEDFYFIEICKRSTRGVVTAQWSLNYGVSSYVCAMQNNVDDSDNLTPMAKLARATYNYGLSASAYHQIAH